MRAQTPASLRSPACYSEVFLVVQFSTFSTVSGNNDLRHRQCRVYFLPDSGRWFSDCADPTIVTRIECYEILRYTGLMRPYAIS
jgi:hypothetical protein